MNNPNASEATGLHQKPAYNSFIGREKEFNDIQQLLSQPECNLLTLTGPGGIGKTRLAQQLSILCSDAFARGSLVVYLQPLRSAEFFIPAIADVLGFFLTGREPPLIQLGHYLGDKEMLVILDNFEHLLDVTDQLSTLVTATPYVKYLITSREALNLQEEWLYPIVGLPFPTESDTVTDEQTYDAVQLFNERAQRVYTVFSPEKETEAIIRICRLVDGMPLALELAAAWRKTLTCQEIADEIQGSLDILKTRLRNVSERHHSIQTIFDQTWQRLTKKEQDVFKRLSVFRGGFQRDAASKVTGSSLPILSVLADKSLLWLDVNGRYQIHELLRQYAAKQLEKSTSDVQQTQADHANYYIQYLHQRKEGVAGGFQREAILEIKEEIDNIRTAWLWAIDHVDADAMQKGSQPLGLYYQFRCDYLEGMTLFSQAIDVLKAQPQSEATDLALLRTLMYQAWYHLRFGHLEGAEACMVQSQVIYRRLNIPLLSGYLTDPNTPLSFIALIRGDYETAAAYAEQVRQVAESQQHPTNQQAAYYLLSEAHLGMGTYEIAQEFAQQAYAHALMNGDRWFMAYILNSMGQISVVLGDNRMGKSHFQSSYEIRHALDDPEGMALALIYLGNLALKEQSFAEAEEQYRRSLTIYQDINDKGGLAATHRGLGNVFYEQGNYPLSQDYFRQALQLAVEIDYRPVLLGLLVNIADLLWLMGQRKRPLALLAFIVHDPTTNYKTQNKAQTRLTNDYQKMVSTQLFAAAIAKGKASNLTKLTTDLLYQLSFPLTPISEKTAAPTKPVQNLINPLTPRELDVLKLLCNGLTNQEIADVLVLAIGTVKFYTGQIYGKLGVRNRVTAVSRARELNLIRNE